MPSPVLRTVTGRIDFFQKDGPQWGREHFTVSEFAHGRTYRAAMEMDDHDIFRDANWTMSPEWKPVEGFSRETVAGRTAAHSWYRIDGTTAEFESWSPEHGRVSDRLTAEAPIGHLGLHALTTDCMVSAARQCVDAGVEKKVTCLANSLDGYGRGASRALLAAPLVTWVGTEELTVGAGTFDAEHFQVRWSDTVPTLSDFWVLREFFLPLKLIGASDPVWYELGALSID